jgi:hypothetical protein
MDEDSEQEHEEDEDSKREEDFIRALFSHSLQIRVLEIQMQHSSELVDILSSSSCGFKSLQHLSIGLVTRSGANDGSSILEAFGGSPTLAEVKLDGVVVGKPYRDLNLPWQQLQVFEHLDFTTLDDVLDVVSLCPGLQKYIAYCDVDNFTEAPSDIVRQTALTHLELSFDSLALLQCVMMPSLTFLHLSGVDNVQLTYLNEFLSRSQCSIQDLHFSPFGTSLQYSTFLELSSSVTRLTLMLHNTTQLDEFRSALTPEQLPRLEVFSIQVWQRVDSDPLALCTPQLMSSLAHIIQSRPRNLQSFEFYPTVFKSANDLLRKSIDLLRALLVPYRDKLRVWIQGGMKLHLFLGTCSCFSLHVNVLD